MLGERLDDGETRVAALHKVQHLDWRRSIIRAFELGLRQAERATELDYPELLVRTRS